MIKLKNIETIIFDLGGVIIDLDSKSVIDQFRRYSNKTARDIMRLISKSQDLIDYEIGKMSDSDFVKQSISYCIPNCLKLPLRLFGILLGNIKREKLHLMLALKDRFNLLILSNTNAIHQKSFDQRVGELIPSRVMSDMVNTAYYSHELGLRKLDPNIYKRVIDLQNLNPTRTLFFDDRHENINMAQDFGIQAILVEHSDHILDLLR